MNDAILWMTVTSPTDKRIPKAAKTSGITQDGKVFVWAGIAGPENTVTLCATYDGVEMAVVDDHVYLPAEWVVKEYPQLTELCGNIRKKLVEFKNKNPVS